MKAVRNHNLKNLNILGMVDIHDSRARAVSVRSRIVFALQTDEISPLYCARETANASAFVKK
jgi:hypothetical protein